MSEYKQLNELSEHLGFSEFYQGRVDIKGRDPLLRSRHKLGEAVSTALVLQGKGAAAIHKIKTGNDTDISISMTEALHSIHPGHFVWQNSYKIDVGCENVPMNGFYQCRDNSHVYLFAGPPYMKLLNGYLKFFNCGNVKEEVQKVISGWDGPALEQALNEAGVPGTLARSREEWLNHPQGKALQATPVIKVEKLADTEATSFEGGEFPLNGIRVLDMGHVLAGPRSAQCLAEYGAEVLHIQHPQYLDPLTSNLSTNRGKRNAYIDLNRPEDQANFKELMKDADVFVQSWRPQVARRFHFTPEDLIENRKGKGLICISIDAYGFEGPYKNWPGFDMNGQVASGFAVNEGSKEDPKISPVYYLNDLLSAYLASSGALSALISRAKEGGSYHVKVSLARTSMWVEALGLLKDNEISENLPGTDVYPAHLETESSAFGKITYLADPLNFSNNLLAPLLPPHPYGSDQASWL